MATMSNLKLIVVMATVAASQADNSLGCALVQRATHMGRASVRTEDSGEALGKRLDDAIAMLPGLAKSATLDARHRGAALGQLLQITESLQQHARNATEHLNSTHQSILEEVVILLESAMYSSMDIDHSGDQTELNSAVDAVVNANIAIAGRLSATGDVGMLSQGTSDLEVDHTNCTSTASSLSTIKSTKWSELTSHISTIPAAPACASLPANMTAATMHSFFSSNNYAEWFEAQKLSFDTKYKAYTLAESNSAIKLSDCETLKTQLDTEYCAWKLVLEAGCSSFDSSYDEKKQHADAVMGNVQTSMEKRIEAFKAGETAIAHVKYLLGLANFTDNFVVSNISRFEITFPAVPTKELCSLSPLSDPKYNDITCVVTTTTTTTTTTIATTTAAPTPWIDVLRYTSSYVPTAAASGVMADSSTGFAKLSDDAINNIPALDGWNYYRLSTDDPDVISPVYVRTQQAWSDTAPSFGFGQNHICQGSAFAQCVWESSISRFDTLQWGNDCNRWFTDYFNSGVECYPSKGPARCFNAGGLCSDHKVIRNVVIAKRNTFSMQ